MAAKNVVVVVQLNNHMFSPRSNCRAPSTCVKETIWPAANPSKTQDRFGRNITIFNFLIFYSNLAGIYCLTCVILGEFVICNQL